MPEQTTTIDRTQHEARSVHLAAALARISETICHRASRPNVLREQLLADIDAIGRTAAAAQNRKVTATRLEYEVLWHADGDDTTIRMTESQIGNLSRARRLGVSRVGSYGTTHYTINRCVHVIFDDDWTVIGPWEKVDERGLLVACVTCGAQVFRADSFDGLAVSFFDAEPATDGEAVLVPSDDDGGMPTAVYGEEPTPGRRRYRRHAENCAPAKPSGSITAETAISIPPNPPFTYITVRHPDGRAERIDVPSHVKMPDGTLSDVGTYRLRVPLAEAGYRVVEMTTIPNRDVNGWVVERVTTDGTTPDAGVA